MGFERCPTGHGHLLNVLARADVDKMKGLAESLIDLLDPVEVLKSRTGLVMLPMRDTVHGIDFHLGEVLVAEAHINVGSVEGYGMVVGRDLEHAMAMALIDAAALTGIAVENIWTFVDAEARRIADVDRRTLCDVEATRVVMETF